MKNSLEIRPRITTMGCGIYEAGDAERCYVKLFVTDTGYVLPTNHRSLSEEDLLDVYKQGYLDGLAAEKPSEASNDETQDQTSTANDGEADLDLEPSEREI